MSETERIELLLLQNRGLTDDPEMLGFDAVLVTKVFVEIVHAGYLRSLNLIPAMEFHSGYADQYVFSSAGRIRYYQLQRKLEESGRPDATTMSSKP